MARYGWCNGILWDYGFVERICPLKENCQYYDERFYVRGYDMKDFEQLHNVQGQPCTYFLPRRKREDHIDQNPFGK